MTEAAYRTNDRRVVSLLLLGLVVVFGAAYVVAHYVTSERVPQGTTVAGVDIGGLRPAAAQQRLRHQLAEAAAAPLTVTANGVRGRLRPGDAGLRLDVPATVAHAGTGRSWDPRQMWDYLVGGGPVRPVVSVDEPALADAVEHFAATADRPAVEGAVRFRDGQAVARYPRSGVVLDRDKAAAAVREHFLVGGGPVELPVVADRPAVDKDAVSRAMDRFANPAMSGPVVLQLDGEGVRLEPEDFSAVLSMRPEGDALEPVLDRAALKRLVAPRLAQITTDPRDATVRLVDGEPRVVPARSGTGYDPDQVADHFLDALTRTGPGRTIPLGPVEVAPDVSTRQARAWRITERVSSSAIPFTFAAHRNEDLARAARLVDGTVLAPGATVDLQRLVDVGDHDVGVVATTAYDAASLAGLKATVVGPEAGLRVRNATRYGVLIAASVEESTPSRQGLVRVSMWSKKQAQS